MVLSDNSLRSRIKVCVITVAYNTSQECELFLSSLWGSADTASLDLSLIIVNNSQDENEANQLDVIASAYDSTKVIHSPDNVGYFRGINIGIKSICQQDLNAIDLMIVCNNDIIFPSQFFRQLAQSTDKLAPYSVICPQIVSSDGRYENPHVIAPASLMRELLYTLYYSNIYLARTLILIQSLFGEKARRLSVDDNQKFCRPFSIYQGYGALYLLTRRYIKEHVCLPDQVFLMFEEFFLSEQIARHGDLPYFFPDLKVFHLGKASTGKMPKSFIYCHAKRSFLLYRKLIKVFGSSHSIAYKLALEYRSNYSS